MNIVFNSFFSCFNSFTVITAKRYRRRYIDKINDTSVHTLYFTSVFVITNNRIFTNLIILAIRLNQNPIMRKLHSRLINLANKSPFQTIFNFQGSLVFEAFSL